MFEEGIRDRSTQLFVNRRWEEERERGDEER